jgi:thiamine-phosphate pyrophosphorylase
LPPLQAIIERAAWWAEIFETPCVAYAPSLDAVAALARTGAEFIALGEAVWSHAEGPADALRLAGAALGETEAAR